MNQYDSIPNLSGLFWYFENGKTEPEPVKLDADKFAGKFRGFNGRIQSWLRDGEYLVGPQAPPKPMK